MTKTKLYPLALTPGQRSVVNGYCLDQGYYLDEDGRIPYIGLGRRRWPLQLVKGKLVVIEDDNLIDIYRLANDNNKLQIVINRLGINNTRIGTLDTKLGEFITKGIGIQSLEL